MKKLIIILTILFTNKIYAQLTFGTTTPLSKIYISLLKQDSSNTYKRLDGAALAFSNSFGNTTYGPQDAIDFGNANDNLLIVDKGKNLSIDGRLPATPNDTIPLAITKLSSIFYQLQTDASDYIANGVDPYLFDSYKGTVIIINGLSIINFKIDSLDSNTYINRFKIIFKSTPLPVNSIVLNTTISNNNTIINWNTIGEKNLSRFEIEKSYDGKTFFKIETTLAKNTNTTSYSFIDINSNNITYITYNIINITYYRIKAISNTGTITYSVVVSSNNLIFNIYPNPVINNLHIQPNKYMIGYSNINIFSLSGKLVLSNKYIIDNNILNINLDNLPHSEYILQIYSNHKTYTKIFMK